MSLIIRTEWGFLNQVDRARRNVAATLLAQRVDDLVWAGRPSSARLSTRVRGSPVQLNTVSIAWRLLSLRQKHTRLLVARCIAQQIERRGRTSETRHVEEIGILDQRQPLRGGSQCGQIVADLVHAA